MLIHNTYTEERAGGVVGDDGMRRNTGGARAKMAGGPEITLTAVGQKVQVRREPQCQDTMKVRRRYGVTTRVQRKERRMFRKWPQINRRGIRSVAVERMGCTGGFCLWLTGHVGGALCGH